MHRFLARTIVKHILVALIFLLTYGGIKEEIASIPAIHQGSVIAFMGLLVVAFLFEAYRFSYSTVTTRARLAMGDLFTCCLMYGTMMSLTASVLAVDVLIGRELYAGRLLIVFAYISLVTFDFLDVFRTPHEVV